MDETPISLAYFRHLVSMFVAPSRTSTLNTLARQTLIVAMLLSCGCADTSRITRKDVATLYAEAVASANAQMQVDPSSGASLTTKDVIMTKSDEQLVLPESISVADMPNMTPGLIESGQPTLGRVPASPVVYQPGMLPPPPSSGNQLGGNQLVSEVFEETDVREVLQILQTATGATIIVDDQVAGTTSAQLNKVGLDEALTQILLPLGYVWVYRDGVYMVAPPDPQSPLYGFISRRFQYTALNHPARKLADLLPPRFKNFYQVSEDRNIIIIDAPEMIGRDLEARLQELDQPVQQVMLEAIVCVTSPESNFRFGMDWNHVVTANGVDQLNVGITGLAMKGSANTAGNNALSDFSVTSAFVKLLSQQGYVTIRAAPRVTAKDGEKATISIARETFFTLQPNSNQLFFNNNFQKVEAGISLIITPHVRGDLVAMEIEKAEVSEDIRTNEDLSAQTSSTTFPIINRRQVSTKVDVRDGQTIAIGGLIQRQTVDKVTRIPFLGDLPAVGALFRSVEKQERDVEVAIFISPRIVPLLTP